MAGTAFVGGEFEYDVFVSYTWVNNNENGPAGKWVSEFRQRLGAALDERLGRTGRSKFFFDVENLGKNVDFGPQIEAALKKSATVVAVISKGYIESPNCREEMRCFDRFVTGPLSKSGRLYLAWYDAHEARSEWPDEFREEFAERVRGVIGYEFFAPLPGVPSGRPLRAEEAEYQGSLLRLTTQLAKHLTERSSDVSSTTDEQLPTRSGPTVLLGHSAPDRVLRKRRRDLASWCRSAGLHVLGEQEYSPTPHEFQTEFVADLKHADLLVQLFSDNWITREDSEFPEGWEDWQQRQAADAGIEIIQWRDRGLSRPAPDESLEDDERRHFDLIFDDQVIAEEPAALHQLVVERAQAAFDLGRNKPVLSGERSVLIKVTEVDYRQHKTILHQIGGNQALCSFAHNGRSVVERWRKRNFDAVVVVLGAECPQDWRDDREDELIESLQSFRDAGPVHAWFDTGSYRGAPPLVGPGMLVIHGEQELPVLFEAIERREATT